jgi:hypothetical protein
MRRPLPYGRIAGSGRVLHALRRKRIWGLGSDGSARRIWVWIGLCRASVEKSGRKWLLRPLGTGDGERVCSRCAKRMAKRIDPEKGGWK